MPSLPDKKMSRFSKVSLLGGANIGIKWLCVKQKGPRNILLFIQVVVDARVIAALENRTLI